MLILKSVNIFLVLPETVVSYKAYMYKIYLGFFSHNVLTTKKPSLTINNFIFYFVFKLHLMFFETNLLSS